MEPHDIRDSLKHLLPGPDCDRVPVAVGDFGYEESNPIPGDAQSYCKRQRFPSDRPYWFHRLGSLGEGPDRHILDAIELLCSEGESRVKLFFDMYREGHSSFIRRDLGTGSIAGKDDAHRFHSGLPEDMR